MGEVGGATLYAMLRNGALNAFDFLGLGEFKVTETEIDLSRADISALAEAFADPNRFEVQFTPDEKDRKCCPKGAKIVPYQIISTTGINGTFAHVDARQSPRTI